MSNKTLNVDQLVGLLRLHLMWPENRTLKPSEEANEFYLWLTHELGQDEVAQNIGDLTDIKHFIDVYGSVLSRAQYIKSRLKEKQSDARGEPRLDVNTQVFYLIYDSEKEPGLEGAIQRGLLLDIARNGMRIETSLPVPIGSILSLTVAQVGFDVRLYHLTGEVRWMSEYEDSYQLGVSVFNIEDYEDWQDFYDLTAIS